MIGSMDEWYGSGIHTYIYIHLFVYVFINMQGVWIAGMDRGMGRGVDRGYESEPRRLIHRVWIGVWIEWPPEPDPYPKIWTDSHLGLFCLNNRLL